MEEFPEHIEPDFMFDDTELPPDHRSGFIAVVGRPNVGKSTLINAFLREKVAIVSPKAQTTQVQLLGILTRDDAQLIFVDTPGIHQPYHKFGEFMVENALQAIPDADIIVWLVDGTKPPHKEDRLVAEAIAKVKNRPPTILAVNKVDLLRRDQAATKLEAYLKLLDPDLNIAISALEGHNRTQLLKAIIGLLPYGPRYFPEDQLTDQHIRFIAAEMIREATLELLSQEIPHALFVQVEEFTERSDNMTYISAIINVERESQKPIVIGRRASMLKKIGQRARTEIEAMLETKVYLDLRVKVRPNWRKKKKELEQLGYTSRG